ncbi:hypothetical protein IAT38_008265 [Cryptococcus sp. DSM 104549]
MNPGNNTLSDTAPLEELLSNEGSPLFRKTFLDLIREGLPTIIDRACPVGTCIRGGDGMVETSSERVELESTTTSSESPISTRSPAMRRVNDVLLDDMSSPEEIKSAVTECHRTDIRGLDLALTLHLVIHGGTGKWLHALGQLWLLDPRYILDHISDMTAFALHPHRFRAGPPPSLSEYDAQKTASFKALINFVGYVYLQLFGSAGKKAPKVTSVTGTTSLSRRVELRKLFAIGIEDEKNLHLLNLLYFKVAQILLSAIEQDIVHGTFHDDWLNDNPSEDAASSPHAPLISSLSHLVGAGRRGDYLLCLDAVLATLLYPEESTVDKALENLREDQEWMMSCRGLLERD